MSTSIKFIMTVIVSILIGATVMYFWGLSAHGETKTTSTASDEPLYWVAPMDPNYRRDKPGKSPMGMDLVPVFADDSNSQASEAGVVEIAPHVVNNLGVRTAKVEIKALDSTINTVGYVQYNENELVHIHPRVSGWIERLYIRAEGDPVIAQEPLYDLYSPELVNAQEEMLIAKRLGDQALINSSKERMRALQISDRFIDKLLKNGQVSQTVTFYAPQAGVVDKLEVREGFYVTPDKNLMTIGSLETVWVEAEVFERDASRVAKGQRVKLSSEGFPGRVWQGAIDYIYPTLRPESRTLRLRIGLANTDQLLKPNMYTQLAIQTREQATVVVPQSAVIRTGKQNRVVLAKEQGQFKSVAVTLGRINNDYAEILDGVSEGDVVVTSAQFLIDSESSKTSDFKRMDDSDNSSAVWMQGEINDVIAEDRTLNITHEAVPEWDMMGMTMNFIVDEAVEFSELKAGQILHFQTERTTQGFLIKEIHITGSTQVEVSKDSDKDKSTIDHSDH